MKKHPTRIYPLLVVPQPTGAKRPPRSRAAAVWQPAAPHAPSARRPRRVVRRRARSDARQLRFEDLDARILLHAANPIVTIHTVVGSFQVELLADAAPQTVANFLKYVTDGDYNNTFIHRSIPNFVVQGGGYSFNGTVAEHIDTDPPVVNEFSPTRSNIRGTVAMAKLDGNPNSATSEWFVNVGDNSANLDNQNGGFTVFARVLDGGMQVVDAIAALQRVNAGEGFETLPVLNSPPTYPDDLVILTSVVLTGSIHGTVFADANGNGQLGAGEQVLAGRTVYVDANNNGAFDAGERSATTDASGQYSLHGVDPGTVTVREVLPAGWTLTSPTGGGRQVTVASGQDSSGNDFGSVPAMPVLPDLHSDFDTVAPFDNGGTNTDNVTRLQTLRFVISGVATGATVNLFDGQTLIGSAVATGSTVTIDTSSPLGNGPHTIIARQTHSGATSGDSPTLTVNVDAAAPVFTPIGTQNINSGEPLDLDVATSEEGNVGAFYRLTTNPSGMTIHPTTGVITFTPTEQQVGHQAVTVEAVDLAGNVSTINFDVAVNGRPLLAPIDNQKVNRGATLSFIIDEASDVDVLDFELLPVDGQPLFPTGATVTKTGDITARFDWTPDAGLAAGTYHVRVRVVDPGGLDAFQSFQIELNVPPVLPTIEDKTIDELATLTFSAAATDEDVGTLTYALLPVGNQPFPTGATINSAGLFQWTPSEAQGPGTYDVTVRATDSGGLTAERSFKITVGEVNSPPVLAAISDKTINRGDSLSFTAAASDGDLPANTLTFSLDQGAPDGASIDANSGAFTWSPLPSQTAGNYSITVRVSDGVTSDARTLQVRLNDAPALDAIDDKTVDELAELSFMASATDQDAVTYTLEPVAGQDFPTGATIDAATGEFQWTPTEAHGPGVYHVTVRATDTSGLSHARSLEITVAEIDQAPVLAPIADQSVDQGDTVSVTAVATDDDLPAQALLYSLDPDAPAGAAIDPITGQFTWPVSDSQPAGTYSVTIRLSQDGGQTFAVSQLFQIEVNATDTDDGAGFVLFRTAPLNGAETSAGPLGSPLAVRDALFSSIAPGVLFGGFNTTSGFEQFSDANGNSGRLQSGIDNSQVGPDTGVQHAVEELLKELESRSGDVKQTSGEEGKGDEVKPAVNLEPPKAESGNEDAKEDGTQGGAAQNGQDAAGPTGIRVSRRRGGAVYRVSGSTSDNPPPSEELPPPRDASSGADPSSSQGAALRRDEGRDQVADVSGGNSSRRVAQAAFFMPLLVSQLPKENQAKRALTRKQRS